MPEAKTTRHNEKIAKLREENRAPQRTEYSDDADEETADELADVCYGSYPDLSRHSRLSGSRPNSGRARPNSATSEAAFRAALVDAG